MELGKLEVSLDYQEIRYLKIHFFAQRKTPFTLFKSDTMNPKSYFSRLMRYVLRLEKTSFSFRVVLLLILLFRFSHT